MLVCGAPATDAAVDAQKVSLHEEKSLHHRHHMNSRCSRCPPGWGVSQRCSPEADTVCELCPSGTYSPHHSAVARCWLCSRCGDGLYEAHPCTRRADTLCDRCATLRGPHNGDFSVHCNGTKVAIVSSAIVPQIAVSRSVVLPVLEADENKLSLLSQERYLRPPLLPPPPPHTVTAEEDDSKQASSTSPRPMVQQQDEAAAKQSQHLALSAAAIATLQAALLVLAAGSVYLVARRLRTATCLRSDTDPADKERTVQEETLLQDLKPREYPDNEP
ncbi:hypothetical protein B566_EDAN009522 [Ephemera danica]|nr:hypothetical protein B566_EDAN009522 [Ephemera danica]